MMEPSPLVVESFRVHRVSAPLPRPYVSGMHDRCAATENVLVELVSGEFVGHGRAFVFRPEQADAIRAMVVSICRSLLGGDVSRVRQVWARLWRERNFVGTGLASMAVGAVDSALWDLLARRVELPLFKLLGAAHEELRVYASGGWFSDSSEELVDEAVQFADQGYAGYKLKIGHADWRVDVKRVERVVAAVGDRIAVMVDANQSWTVKQAIAAGRVLAELGVNWLEEPVPAEDAAASARVSAALPAAVASGETLFSREAFHQLLQCNGADVVMPNVVRLGGPGAFMEVAALAAAYGVPVSSHTYTEVSSHLMAACANAGLVEYIPGWWDDLFEDAPVIDRGSIRLSDAPGLGFVFSARALGAWGSGEGPVTGSAPSRPS